MLLYAVQVDILVSDAVFLQIAGLGEAGVTVKVTKTDFEGALTNVAVFGKSVVFS